MHRGIKDQFLLDPEIAFLNHGSFGACPRPVFESYQRWQRELEQQPVEFLKRKYHELLADARAALGAYLGCDADSLVFIANATWGVNVVVRSLDFEPGDQVLTTNHEYGACAMTWEWELQKAGAELIRQSIATPVSDPCALVEQFWEGVTPQTKVVYLSHITSPTALIFPVKEICRRAHEMGILSIIDGAHAPGQMPLNLTEIGADIYTGNLHKWALAPKGSGFLYVRPEEQDWIESLVISWGWGRSGMIEESTFVQRNEWQGTRDPAAFLATPDAIAFMQAHDWPEVRRSCHRLARMAREQVADLTGIEPISPASSDWFRQMVACPLPDTDLFSLKSRMYDEFKVEAPLIDWNGRKFIRLSFQAYNDENDLDRALESLRKILPL